MHSHKRDDEKEHDKKKPVVEEEELSEAEKPDFPDVDGDGDREEPISKASKEKKEKGGDDEKSDKDVSKVPPQLRKHVKGKMKESRVMTHEKLTNLYESRFGQRDTDLFNRLKKAWIKEEN